MSSSSLETAAEQVQILLIQAHPLIVSSGIEVVSQDQDNQARKDRIVVGHQERETELFEPDGKTPLVIRVPIVTTIRLVSPDSAKMDALLRAFDEAMETAAPLAIAQAQASFPYGCDMRPEDGGNRETQGNTRQQARTVFYVVTLAEN